jgi:hypothetical protein
MRQVLIWLGLCLVLTAQDTELTIPNGFMTGQDYLNLSAQSRADYAVGFFNGMTVAGVISSESKKSAATWLSDWSKGMTNTQVAEIIRKEIADHPAEWNYRLNRLSASAMLDACKSYLVP